MTTAAASAEANGTPSNPPASAPPAGGQPATSQAAVGNQPSPSDPAAPAAAAQNQPVTTSTPQAPVKPDGLDAKYWDDKTGLKADLLTKDLADLTTFKAEMDIKTQGVPKTPAEYKVSLEGFTPPEGVEISIDDNHPLAAPAKDFAHKWQLPQEAMNELVRLQADYVANEAKTFNETMKAERAKLGQNAEARIEAVKTALIGRLGEAGKALVGTLVSAAVIEAYEGLLRTTGAPGPHRSAPANTQPQVDFSKMSPLAKFSYHLNRSAQQRNGARN